MYVLCTYVMYVFGLSLSLSLSLSLCLCVCVCVCVCFSLSLSLIFTCMPLFKIKCHYVYLTRVEFAILMDNAEYEITSIGVIIRTENTFAPCPSYFMCRVVFPSETGAKSLLTPDEICWREIIEYRTSDRNDNSVVHLQLLFMDKPNQFQELIVKHFKASNDILEIKPEIFSDTIEVSSLNLRKRKLHSQFICSNCFEYTATDKYPSGSMKSFDRITTAFKPLSLAAVDLLRVAV